MKYLLKTMEEKPQELKIDVFPKPSLVLKISKNLNRELEVYILDEGRKPVKLYDTLAYKSLLERVGQKCLMLREVLNDDR